MNQINPMTFSDLQTRTDTGKMIFPMNMKKKGPPPVVTKSMLAEKLQISPNTLRRYYLTDQFFKDLGYDARVKWRTQFYIHLDPAFFQWLEGLHLEW